MLTASPSKVREDGTALVIYQGQPNRSVLWVIQSGDGVLIPITNYTDETGRAVAKYIPGTPDTVAVIRAEVGV